MSSSTRSGKEENSRYKIKYVRRNKLVRPQIEMKEENGRRPQIEIEQENGRQHLDENKPKPQRSESKTKILEQKKSEGSCTSSDAHQKLEAAKSKENLIDENGDMQSLCADYMGVPSMWREPPVDHLEPLDNLMNVEDVLAARLSRSRGNSSSQEHWQKSERSAVIFHVNDNDKSQ